jgi:protein-S-isoprenylcysteine O-methyltransferase Ste14
MTKARVLVFLQFGLLGALLMVPQDTSVDSPEIFTWLAPGLQILALTILILAAIALRPALTVSPIPRADAPLITRGIYKYIRHPMYSAVIAIGASIMLLNPTLITYILWILLVLTLMNKAEYEDGLLRTKHQDAVKYQLRTGTFAPKLRKVNEIS